MQPDVSDPTLVFPDDEDRPKTPLRLFKIIAAAATVVAVVIIAAVAYLYYESQKSPEFYLAALSQPSEEAQAKGSQLETEVLDLHNSTLQLGNWQGRFEEGEINGWLAMELPTNFPELLPKNIQQPRVGIEPGELNVAFRVNYKNLRGIAAGKFEIFCTDEKDQIAIRVIDLGVGIIPVSITQFAPKIVKEFEKFGVMAHWSEIDGDPALILTIPQDKLTWEGVYRFEVNSIEIGDKEIVVSGVTEEIPTKKQ